MSETTDAAAPAATTSAAVEPSSLDASGTGLAPNVLDSDTGTGDGPSSLVGFGPPSPLTGCYLLIIVGEPHSDGHKDIILQRLLKGEH